MDVAESFISGFFSNTYVFPVASITTTSETASEETALSEFPGNGNPPLSDQEKVHYGKGTSWPIYPNDKSMK
jgi:hypothetical protein